MGQKLINIVRLEQSNKHLTRVGILITNRIILNRSFRGRSRMKYSKTNAMSDIHL